MSAPEGVHLLSAGNHRRPCPRCQKSPRDNALGVTVEQDGAVVWHCFRCGLAGAQHADRQTITRPSMKPVKAIPQPIRHETLSDEAARLWRGCYAVRGTLANTYLQARHCVEPPPEADLRFCPRAYHWPTKTYHPALVALVTDFADASIQRSLHFTFLSPNGHDKAAVEPSKLLLYRHQKQGGVIRLWPDEVITQGLALAEGIESALSAAHLFTPVWATVDAGNMASLPVIGGIGSLSIYADHDVAGLAAAHELANRWRSNGRQARVFMPREPGLDANDAAQAVA